MEKKEAEFEIRLKKEIEENVDKALTEQEEYLTRLADQMIQDNNYEWEEKVIGMYMLDCILISFKSYGKNLAINRTREWAKLMLLCSS